MSGARARILVSFNEQLKKKILERKIKLILKLTPSPGVGT